MTPRQLENAARALFGNDWKPAFCERFQINPRTLRHMLAGGQEIPEGLAFDIAAALEREIQNLQRAMP